jgi:predicted DNA-binding protein with PD1-like motif
MSHEKMRYARSSKNAFLVRLDSGDDVVESLEEFADTEGIQSASFQGLGSLQRARIGHFDFQTTHEYEFHEYQEDLEVLSAIGNITLLNGRPIVHLHLSLSRRDCSEIGGHADKGCIANLLEIQLTKLDTQFHRKRDAELGLNIIEIP